MVERRYSQYCGHRTPFPTRQAFAALSTRVSILTDGLQLQTPGRASYPRAVPPFTTLLFDFDYTLADSSDGIVICTERALDEMGYPPPASDAVRATIGLTLEDMFETFTGSAEARPAAEFRRRYITHANQIMLEHTRVYPWLRELASRLLASSYRLGIVSTKYGSRIERALDAAGLDGAFSTVIGSDRVSRPKPDPEGLHLAMAILGSERAQTLFVGDSPTDARTAAEAGIDFVGVLTGVTPRARLSTHPHLAILNTANELPRWLAAL